MCKIVKLIGNNFQRSEELLRLIDDSIRMQLNHMIKHDKKTEEYITSTGVLCLIQGLDAYSSLLGTKRLISLAKTMVILAQRDNRPLLLENGQILVHLVRLLADLQVKPGNELFSTIQDAIQNQTGYFLNRASLGDLSHLLLCSSGSEGTKYLSPESR